ncbi:hypothetical protein L226DRAFT_377632 [Lentinus tigrinus ALCF2SS1-7]|uniref:Uncharacterized protein n=1 Tax=Lentinus tigrinus ALCF2SS1-6 TaxID=1328759 RepID=A0A5C2SLW0_9APHY|nr:hypothetical protein L227DRAFT_323647 [Lentinus tigrinus ALCF2SS1-6]RPD76473.1 hypothetical protein L226DRAFT_377632 [Lentinus tigrinus ALCF2SS1-7]
MTRRTGTPHRPVNLSARSGLSRYRLLSFYPTKHDTNCVYLAPVPVLYARCSPCPVYNSSSTSPQSPRERVTVQLHQVPSLRAQSHPSVPVIHGTSTVPVPPMMPETLMAQHERRRHNHGQGKTEGVCYLRKASSRERERRSCHLYQRAAFRGSVGSA